MMSSKHTDDPEPLSSRGKSIITKSLNIGVKKNQRAEYRYF